MRPFILHNPVKLRFGRGELNHLGEEIPEGARVLLVYGGGSVKCTGTLDRVHEQLKGKAAHVVEFGGVQANPEYAQLMPALPIIEAEKLDFILAVGGGSVVDGAKFIAAATAWDGDPWEFVQTRQVHTGAMPLGAVMTLPATGSEMNGVSVISRSDLGQKLSFFSPYCYPVFSIVDPQLTETLPPRQIANGVVDAFVHVLEQYVVMEQHAPLQARFSEGVLRTLLDYGERTYRDVSDHEARDAFCYAATMALNGLIGVGVTQDWSTHNIGHELTARYGIDHARSLATVMFDNFELRWSMKQPRLTQLGRRVFGLAGSDDDRVAREALAAVRRFFEALDVPTSLGAYPNVEADADEHIAKALEAHGTWPMGEKRSVDIELVSEMIRRSVARVPA